MKARLIWICLILLSLSIVYANTGWEAPQRKTSHPMPSADFYRWSQARADSAHGFDVQKYVIDLTINTSSQHISGNVLATVEATDILPFISYELVGLTVSSVKVNGIISTFTHTNGIIQIPVNAIAGQIFTTQVYYSGNPQLSANLYSIGMHFVTNSVFTISDPDAGRQWWPCYDHPWDKAVVDLHITMRNDWKVAANGLRHSITDNGNGTATTVWLGEHPMTTYLVCITAGPYVEIAQSALEGELPILSFVTQAQYNNAMIDFAPVPAMIEYFSQIFGPYPFEKYGHATVSMNTYGAMEHQTMTTLGSYIITGNHTHELTIAHELAHQWYGNAVSFLDFKDVWLSEGFATYSEHLWTDKALGWASACAYVLSSYHTYYMNWENANGAATIYNPSFYNYFSPPSYEKGASVLHMLRLKIGNANFFQLLSQWFETYKHGNAITSEFQAMAESISGMDLTQFFQQWIYGNGIPSVQYSVLSKSTPEPQVKILAKSASPTATDFHLEVPFRIVHSTGTDSLLVHATPNGAINIFTGIPSPDEVIANYNNWTLLRGITSVAPVITECLASNASVLLSWPEFGFGEGYRYLLWRKTTTEQTWQQITPIPLTQTTYTDTNVQNGITYQYLLRAIDLDDFISQPSALASATPVVFSFASYLLVVDESRDGNGTNINPNDQMVDDFYAAALAPIPYSTWDIASQGAPPLSTLGNYKILFWHDDDFSENLLLSHQGLLSSYLLGGGKVIISGWKTASVLMQEFINRFSPGLEIYYDNGASLISAESQNYPTLLVDPNKLVAPWNGMLPMIYTFGGDLPSLYTANMLPSANGQGRNLAFHQGNLCFFGFPLYFMQAEGVRSLMQQLLPELHPVSSEDPLASPNAMHLSAYPNPFNPSTTISFSLPRSGPATLNLYNPKGQKVLCLATGEFQKGTHSVQLDASSLASGVYLLRLDTAGHRFTRKITLMK